MPNPRTLTEKPIGDECPTAPAISTFDWDELDRRLGEAKEQCSEQDFQVLGDSLGKLLGWVVGGNLREEWATARIARRVIALCWVVNPCLFDGSPSLSSLAERLGCHKVHLSEPAAQFSREFGVRNRAQRAHNPHL